MGEHDSVNRLISYTLSRIISMKSSQKVSALETFDRLPFFIKKLIIHRYMHHRMKELRNIKALSNLYFFVTNSCNLGCYHCFYRNELNKTENELTLEEIQKIAKSLHNKLDGVSITGGEPFIREDISEICLAFYNLAGVNSIGIATNGYSTDKIITNIKFLLETTGMRIGIQVSLDGPPEVHNKIRGSKHAYENAVRTIKELKSLAAENSRLYVIINTVISKQNSAVFIDFYKYVKENFDVTHSYHFLRQDGFDVHELDQNLLLDPGNEKNRLPPVDECREILKKMRELEGETFLTRWQLKLRDYHLKIVEEKKPVVKCIGNMKCGVLFPDGGVSLCEVVKPFDNIRNYDYDYFKCWSSESAHLQRQKMNKCFCTYVCYLMDSMLYDEATILSVLGERKPKSNNRNIPT